MFLYFVSESSNNLQIQFLTLCDPEQRGAQLSLRIVGADARQLATELEKLGVCVSFIFSFRIITSFYILSF